MTVTWIYALIDPRDGRIRYIGKALNPNYRLHGHLRDADKGRKTHCARWLRGLLKAGLRPVVFPIEECPGDGCEEEKYHIRLAISDGVRLTNHTQGGEGLTGYRHVSETKRKISLAHQGKSVSAETSERIRLAHLASTKVRQVVAKLNSDPGIIARRNQSLRGQKRTPEQIENIRAAQQRPEVREKKRLARAGWKPPPEAVRKVADANRGRKPSPEAIAKRVAKIRGRKQTPEVIEKRIAPLRGRPRSEETRRKISESRKKLFAKRAEGAAVASGQTVLAAILPPESIDGNH